MRMSDIIKMSTKSRSEKKKFGYTPSWSTKEDRNVQMKKLNASDGAFSDEHKSIEELYQKYLAETQRIFNRAIISYDILPPASQIRSLAMEVSGKLQVCQVNIMDFFMRSQTQEENYLCSHSVNVTFLSVMVGVWLKYNRSQLSQLAAASTFHDIGMISVLEIAELPRRLNPSEREEVDRHPGYSRDFLEQIQGIDEKIIDAVYDHHKRRNIKTAQQSEYSQIIGLVDTFESMTHPRAYRDAVDPHTAIRTIIEELRGGFDSRVVKALIDNIGIYPAGTFVKLDSGEIGVVIDVNAGSPLSPKVNILFDKDTEKLPEPRTVDLTKQTNIHITNPLREEAQQSIKERLA